MAFSRVKVMKVDYEVLEKFSEQKTINKFNKEIELFLDGKSEKVTREAVAFFYLTLHKNENQAEEKRRGLTLEETQYVIKGLQGQMLTLVEAIMPPNEQRDAFKSIVNSDFSKALSLSQDYDWGRYDVSPTPEV